MAVEREVFRRSGAQMALDGCAGPVGAVLFLGIAVLGLTGVLGSDPLMRLTFGLGFGFFGLFMAVGAVTSLRRGTDDRVIEVGPDGAWLPEMGYLPWSGIAEVRLGTMRGVGGGDDPVTVGYRRLGFVPKDGAIRPSASSSAGWMMARAFFAFVRRIAPQIRLGMDDDSPFSAGEPELSEAQFERLLEATRRYAEVIDLAERRARERVGRWANSEPTATVSRELTVAEVAALDAELATRPEAAAGVPLVDPATVTTSTPRASFGPPASSRLGLVGRLVPAAIPLAMMVGFPAQALAAGTGGAMWPFLVAWVVFLGSFVVLAARPFFAELHRRRLVAASPVSLEVGPEGIRLPPAGRIAWDDVAEIRTERAGFTSVSGGPVERWRLVVVRASGPRLDRTSAVESDRIDARFDDVLDLIRFYHPVVETA